MFLTFFHELKESGLPVTLKEYLILMEAMDAGLARGRVEDFYHLSRAALVKDERHLDRFDRVFARVFNGLDGSASAIVAEIPEEWLRRLTEKFLTDEEKRLGTRNIKLALRRLRKFAREGAPEELDLDDTISSTASKGYLDLKLVPERRNAVKVLLFFDVGGSMARRSSGCARSCSRPRVPNSGTWNTSASIIAFTRESRIAIDAAMTSRSRHGSCSTPIPPTTG